MLEAAAQEITAASGNADVFPVQCDVRDADAVKTAVDACVERLGQTFIFVHPKKSLHALTITVREYILVRVKTLFSK